MKSKFNKVLEDIQNTISTPFEVIVIGNYLILVNNESDLAEDELLLEAKKKENGA